MSTQPEITHILIYRGSPKSSIIRIEEATNEELAIWISEAAHPIHKNWRKNIVKPYFKPPPWPPYSPLK
jgi:hypothetical protein